MCPFDTVKVKNCEVSPEGIRVTMEERIRDPTLSAGTFAALLKTYLFV